MRSVSFEQDIFFAKVARLAYSLGDQRNPFFGLLVLNEQLEANLTLDHKIDRLRHFSLLINHVL